MIWYFVEGGIKNNLFFMKCVKDLGIIFLIFNILKFNFIGCVFDFLFLKLEVLESKLNEMRV